MPRALIEFKNNLAEINITAYTVTPENSSSLNLVFYGMEALKYWEAKIRRILKL